MTELPNFFQFTELKAGKTEVSHGGVKRAEKWNSDQGQGLEIPSEDRHALAMDQPQPPASRGIPSVVFKVGTFEYVLVFAPGGALLALSIYDLITHPQSGVLGVILILLGVLGFLFLLLASFQLEVTPFTVTYVTLFTRKQSMPIEDLARVEIITGGKPPYCMLFKPRENSSASAIAINIKPLKRDDLRKLARFLPKVAPQVQYDRRFLMMAEGKMPSVLFEYQ